MSGHGRSTIFDMNDLASLFQRVDHVMERICGASLNEIFKPPATEELVARQAE